MGVVRIERLWWRPKVILCGLLILVQMPVVAGSGPATTRTGTIFGAGAPDAVPGSYLVELSGNATTRSAGVAAAAQRLAARHHGRLTSVYTRVLSGFSVEMSERDARRLAAEPEVARVEQDFRVHANGVQEDPPWGLDRIDQRPRELDHQYVYPLSSVPVYILDSGIKGSHAEFGGRVAPGYNAINRQDGDADDCDGHGTSAASIAGGATFGVAKHVPLIPVKVLDCAGNGLAGNVIRGLDWIRGKQSGGPAVVNISLGARKAAESAPIFARSVQEIIAGGLTVVTAAGNAAGDACGEVPNEVPGVIVVGATRRNDALHPDSNQGRCVDLYAPGDDIPSAGHEPDKPVVPFARTSAAAPHVAGAAALLLATDPGFTPRQVEAALIASSTKQKISGLNPESYNRLLYVGQPRPDGSGRLHGGLNDMFHDYGDQGGHWTGGDETVSVPLPGGKTAWLFSDTFLGTVNPDHSRPANTPMVHNSIVVQSGSQLTETLTAGTPAAPKSLVGSETDNEPNDAGYWVDDGMVVDNQLKVFYTHYRHTGSGPLDVAQVGTAVASFSVPNLKLLNLTQLPYGRSIKWGTALADHGDDTYIYGVEATGDTKYLHVAKTARGRLAAGWQFWTGSGWSLSESDSSRVMSGVGDGLSVDVIGDEFVLVTQDTHQVFNATFVAYFAAEPTGPFTDQTVLYEAPEATYGTIVYDARLNPQYSSTGKFVMSYNVNSLEDGGAYRDVHLYRPRFVEVTLPDRPDPRRLPPTPTGLRADPDDGGVRLTWEEPAPNLSYRVYMRDAGKSHSRYTRLRGRVDDTSFTARYLTNGNRYEFRVASINENGESPWSLPASAVPHVEAPTHAPGNLRATAKDDGTIALDWDPVPEPDVWYLVFYRDRNEEDQTEFVQWPSPVVGATSTVARNLQEGHRYEFQVAAANSGGTGPRSNIASATSHMALPPAPTDLRATAQPDGTIKLEWTSAGPGLWYFVYVMDESAEEDGFTRWEYPLTDCCTTTAKFLQHDHTYQFKVTATNAAGEGPHSNIASATARFTLPPAPVNLRGEAGDGQATLTWDASSGDVWYMIHQKDLDNDETEFTTWPLPLTTCCTITAQPLANGHTYEFKVTAVNQAGESEPSNVVRVRPMPPLPGKPTDLTPTPQPDGTIKLTWTRPGDNLWYAVYQRNVSKREREFTKWPLPVQDCCTATAALLKHGEVYEFKVAALNLAGEGPHSDPAQATAHYARPAAPTDLRAVAAGDGSVDLDWEAPAPNLYYWVYIKNVSAGQTSFTRAIYPTTKTSMTWGSLRHGDVYQFQVTAENQGGEGPPSNTVQVTARGGLPAPPSNLTATAGDGKVGLRWSASPTPNVWYLVYVAEEDGSWRQLPDPVSSCCSFTVNLLTNGHTYHFKVAATNAAGNSSPSNVATAKPLPPVPEPPSNLTATAGDGKATLRWSASPTPNVWYLVEHRDASARQDWQSYPYPVRTGTSFVATYLTNGHTYQFRVRATNLAGKSDPSNVDSARPLPPFPQPPTNLTATPGDGIATLHWSASPTPNVWYLVEYYDATARQKWQRLKYPVAGGTTITMRYLTNGHTYRFRVRATNLAGDSAPSNEAAARPMPPAPQPPRNLTGNPGETSVQLDWDPSPTPNVYYWVYLRDVSAQEYVFHRLPYPVNKTSLYAQYLNTGDEYQFYVTAVNLAGESTKSNIITVRLKRGGNGCVSLTSNWVGKTDSRGRRVNGWEQLHDVTVRICGWRHDTRMEVTSSWDTNGHELYVGVFLFDLLECETGRLIRQRRIQFPNGTRMTGQTVTDSWPISNDRRYRLRARGADGELHMEGLRMSYFSWVAPILRPQDVIPLDVVSSCF